MRGGAPPPTPRFHRLILTYCFLQRGQDEPMKKASRISYIIHQSNVYLICQLPCFGKPEPKEQKATLMLLGTRTRTGTGTRAAATIATTATTATITLLKSRLDTPMQSATLQFKAPTPLGGIILAPQSNADLPYPRNPPYEVRTPHWHGAPPTDDTTVALNYYNVYKSKYIYLCRYVRMYTSMHVCTHVCMYAYIYIYIYICMYVCLYVCLCVCIYLTWGVRFACSSTLIRSVGRSDPNSDPNSVGRP